MRMEVGLTRELTCNFLQGSVRGSNLRAAITSESVFICVHPWLLLYHIGLKNSHIMPAAHRTKPHVEVGERHPEETQPRPKHMAAIETAHAAVGLLAKRRSGEPVNAAANQMAKRVTTHSVAAGQNRVHRH